MDVVVGVEDSPSAAEAIRWGWRLADASGGSLRAVRAWMYGRLTALPGIERLPDPAEMDERTREEARRIVEDVLGSAPKVDVLVVRGPARHALLAEISAHTPDLVVVGRRGLGPVDARLLGSVGRRLVEAAPCPVVLMPDRSSLSTADAPVLVVGLDGSEHSTRALRVAADIAEPLGGELVLAHVAGPAHHDAAGQAIPDSEGFEHPVLRAASEMLAGRSIRHRGLLLWGDPRSALETAVEDLDADLLVLAARGTGGISRLVLGSVSSYFVQHGQRPVAVVPPEGRVAGGT
jgi:nucleotide-binding universal stress UspA family protein